MQTRLKHRQSGNHGYALILTMIFLAVSLAVFASMMYWTATAAKVSQRNNQYNMSEGAAEAALERAMAPMMRDYLSQKLTNSSYYAALQMGQTNYDGTPWPVTYTISGPSSVAGQISIYAGAQQTTLQPLGSEYANLQGYGWYWTNIATATPIGQPYTVSATVTQIVNFSSIPIFQYAIFYNINLEIDPGAAMFVNGAVWSNAGLWAGTKNLTFNSTVSAVSNSVITSVDPFASGKSDSSAPPHFNVPGQPTSGNTPLTMPVAGASDNNPTNVESILNIPPAAYAMGSTAAYTTDGQEYLANEADLIISNAVTGTNYGSYTPYGTNIIVYYQDKYNTPALLKLTPDFYILKKSATTGLYTNYVSPNLSDGTKCYTNVYYAGWSFITNASFWDYREKDTVQAVQIDVAKFGQWLTNRNSNGGYYYNTNLCNPDKGHTIDSVWVYNSVRMTSSTLPAVRVINGIQLPNADGFTVATPMPIYVYGDYNKQIDSSHVSSGTNTVNTYPAALMGDAITVLSGNWSDSYSLSHTGDTTPNSRGATTTTLNAACLEGIVQSVPSISGNYSGGVENFLRFLENWSGVTSTYNGSIVVMFPSIYSTNYWAYGGYYTAPNRNWGFDYNFLQQSKLPPLTPQLKKLIRVSWAAR